MSYTTKRIEELEKNVDDLRTENEFMRKEIRRLNKKLLMKSDECALFMAKCKTLEDKIYELKPDELPVFIEVGSGKIWERSNLLKEENREPKDVIFEYIDEISRLKERIHELHDELETINEMTKTLAKEK